MLKDYKQPIVYAQNDLAILRSKKMVIGVSYELEMDAEAWVFTKTSKNIIEIRSRKDDKKEKGTKKKKVKSVKPAEILNETDAEAV
jgi:maltodextrin utilization protein YvdJ